MGSMISLKQFSVIFALASFLFSVPVFSKEMQLKTGYVTDNCTGWLNGTKKYDWSYCCRIHDLYYWAGGTKEERDETDLRLRACVEEKVNSFHANIIYFGVRAGRFSPIKFKGMQWGFGWGEEFEHRNLTPREIDQVENSLRYHQDLPVSKEDVTDFISHLDQLSH